MITNTPTKTHRYYNLLANVLFKKSIHIFYTTISCYSEGPTNVHHCIGNHYQVPDIAQAEGHLLFYPLKVGVSPDSLIFTPKIRILLNLIEHFDLLEPVCFSVTGSNINKQR